MKRRFAPLVLIAAAAVAALAAASQADSKQPRCTAPAPTTSRTRVYTRTVLATSTARVYWVTTVRNLGPPGSLAPVLIETRAFGCLRKTGRRSFLGLLGTCDRGPQASKFRLAGRYAGYVRTGCSDFQTSDAVVVRDLATGRIKWSAEAATATPDPGTEVTMLVKDFELKPDGSAVWIGLFDQYPFRNNEPGKDDLQLRKLEPGSPGVGTPVDSGLGIRVGSLALARPRGGATPFYWRKGGAIKVDALH